MKKNKNEILIEIIKNSGMNYDEFAKEIGVTKSFLTKILNGDRNPSYNFINKIKNKFPEIDVNDFFCDWITRNVYITRR